MQFTHENESYVLTLGEIIHLCNTVLNRKDYILQDTAVLTPNMRIHSIVTTELSLLIEKSK